MSGSPLNTVNALFGGSINYGFQAGQVGQVNNYNYVPTLEEVKQKQEILKTEIAAWLSPLDFPQRQKEILQSWHARTGNWFLQRAEFKDWEDVKDDCRTLFCPGQQGAGKTVLASRVVEHLLKQREQEDLVLSIFCSHDSRELHTVENLTGSLLRQVSQQSGEIPHQVQKYYEQKKGSRPKLKSLLETLKVQFRQFQKIYIVVDALDECSTIDSRQGESYNPRTTFLASLQELLKAAPNAAIMITSRPLPALQNQLQWPQIDIAAQDVDISVFLDAQIKMTPRIASYKQDDLIKNKIIANAQGMFLLAALSWGSISIALTLGELRRVLERLPSTLKDMYRISMDRVRAQHESHTKYAMAVLSWVSCAIRPITVDELRYALAIVMVDTVSLDREWLPDQIDLASICYGFITIDQSRILRFAHFSVQEFFDEEKQSGNLFPNASQEISLACLICLTLDDFSIGPDPSESEMRARINDMPFLRYAATYWYRHDFRPKPDSDPALANRLSKLFNEDDQHAYYNWLRIHQPDPSKVWLGECLWLEFADIERVGWYVAYFKLGDVISAPKKQREMSREERCVMDAIQLAGFVRSGEVKHIKVLLDRGITTDFRVADGTPLLSLCGNIETSKLLLERGAQADAIDERGWSPLQCASRGGDLETMKLLLSCGARVRAREGEQSALHDAVFFNHPHAVAFLLASGAEADVNADGEMGKPIHWAAHHGQLQNLKMLLQCSGADLEAKSWGWGVVQSLLGEGQYYVVQGEPSGWGMGSEHREVALFLLDRVSQDQITGSASRNNGGQTLLHWAAEKGYADVVQVSLRSGVDINVLDHIEGREPMTARQRAVATGHADIAELLCKAEEGVNLTDFRGPSISKVADETIDFAISIVHLVKLTAGTLQMCFYRDWRASQNLEPPDLITEISATAIGKEGSWEGTLVTGHFPSNPSIRFTSVVDAGADSKTEYSRIGTGWMMLDGTASAVFEINKDNWRPLYLNGGVVPQSQYYTTFVSLLTTPEVLDGSNVSTREVKLQDRLGAGKQRVGLMQHASRVYDNHRIGA